MARAGSGQQNQDQGSESQQKPASRKASRKSTQTQVKREEAAANPFAAFDRSQLAEKTRVFQLAKALGVPSKELIVALSELGVVKVAQSSLTRAESEQLLDALSTRDGAEDQPRSSADVDAADEKIRNRIRKDVANEINQIERKVEAELSDRADGGADADSAEVAADVARPEDAEGAEGAEGQDTTDAAHEADDAEDTDDTDALSDPEDVFSGVDGDGDALHPEALANTLLTDVEPDLTPAPQDEPAAYTPLFKAPSRSGRRRASRPSGGDAEAAAPKRSTERSAARAGLDQADEVGVDEVGLAGASTSEGEVEVLEEPKAIKGSSRLEAQRRRRSEKREEERKRSRIVSQAEFLARRESVTRTMVVRERERHDGTGKITQVGVLEDGLLVEHFVTSDQQASMIGNIYLGRVQNVLPSMEAAFIDIGQGRNGVLYAGEVDWKAAGLGGRSRRIEHALKSGDQVVVQVTKDPIGHKGARLTTQISLAGRYLVYVPGGRSAGISRKLPAPERKRLKEILNNVVPGKGGAIIRTAAEGVPEEAIAADVNRLHTQWETIQEQAQKHKRAKGAKPVTLYEEPNLLVKVVRDLFNEDFSALIVDGQKSWNTVRAYVQSVAPDLLDRLEKFDRSEHGGRDAFEVYRVDEQIQKALSRSVWLPSGGSLVIDRTEAMTVIDVNTGKFTGSGGSLEETVTSNNLEAAEEIVRQIRLRDIGGIIIIDFIDMILPENQDLVLRRLKEALGRDRTRHQVSEVTSLGLVQMTRKRLGTGLLETFSEPCEHCGGRGIVLAEDPIEHEPFDDFVRHATKAGHRHKPAGEHPAAHAMHAQPSAADTADEAAAAGTGAKSAASAHLDDAELDEIAGSVVVEKQKRREAAGERDEKRSRRRGRRGGSRGRGKPQPAEVEASEVAKTEGAKTEGDPAEQGKSEHQPKGGAKAYEDAVAEFEASPRRKRKTRGNSRSDHRPKREDFDDSRESARVEKPDHGEADAQSAGAEGTGAKGTGAEGTGAKDTGAKGAEAKRARGRRRATRKSTASQPVSQTASAPKNDGNGGRNAKAAGDGAAREEAGARRGRRRATRRSTAR